MAGKATPLTRQNVEPLLVTDADAFTQFRYLRQREVVPAIPELEEQGQQSLPGIEGALLDLYHSLWSPDPSVREEVPADRRYWKEVLGQALETGAYEQLHTQTQLKELPSILGTLAMGQTVLKLVPEEDGEKLQELQHAQAQADGAQQQADQAQGLAETLEGMLGDGQLGEGQPGEGEGQGQPGSGQSQPSQGKPQGSPSGGSGQLSPEQAQALANQLAQAQAQVQTAQAQADAAKATAEGLASELMGMPGSQQAEDKLRELARIGLQAIKDAQAQVQDVSDTVESWGLEEAELYRQGVPEALALLERMKSNANMKKFAALLGRIRQIALRKARSKVQGEGQRVTTVETGRDIRRAHRSELVALVHPATRVQALRRWMRGELLVSGQRMKAKLGHGPVVVCEDASGSMDGSKQQWAKGVVLALADFARVQKRSYGWVMFDSAVKKSKTYPKRAISAQDKLEIAESRAGGGTNFERPLKRAIEMIQKEGLKKADICFVTDGDCDISDQFLAELLAFKVAHEVNILVVICDVGHVTDQTVQRFADRVVRVSAFTAEEAESKIFSQL